MSYWYGRKEFSCRLADKKGLTMPSRYFGKSLKLISISHNSIVVTGSIFNKTVADTYRLAARPRRHSLFGNATNPRKLPVAGKA